MVDQIRPWEKPTKASEFGGDGRRKRHPLRDVYQPPGDTEGATFQGDRPLTAKEHHARNE